MAAISNTLFSILDPLRNHRFRGHRSGDCERLPGALHGKPGGHIRIEGITGKSRYVCEIDVAGIRPLKSNAALRYLWARYRIGLLSEFGLDLK